MTPEHYQQVKTLFYSALEQPPARRAAFLDDACDGDAELRAEVEALLGAHAESDAFIEIPALAGAPALPTSHPPRAATPVGRQIGPYRITRELGRGGMGAVYLGVRDDAYRKFVAIKIVQRGADGDDVVRRFRNERQILAGLDHPNIARLLDGGTTDDGLPYLVMDYVEGQPVTEYCNARRLTTNERLQLFRTICAAVQHAHQNLVVHRDLKPSNILITPDGAPKLLDFGIAKILNSELSPLSTERTRTELRVLTPNYASPEQVRGEKLMTTASDIYSLGVVLYELLAGHRPYRVAGALPHELARVICEQEPTRPSHVISHVEAVAAGDDTDSRLIVTPEAIARDRDTTPEKLRRQLAGDIDNIVLMALRKEPQRRYQSAAEFAADVRRHLDGLPVIARKDTFKYRATKFVKRHKAGVAAAALVALTICAGIVTSLWLAHRAETQRARAERRFGDLRQLSNALLSDIAPKIERLPGSVDAREALVRQSLKYLDSLAQESGDDAQVQSELASAYEKVGSLQGNPSRPNLSDFSGAVASYEKAQDIRRRLLAQDPNNFTHLRLLANNHHELVNVRWWMNNSSESIKESESALALYEKLVAEQPGDLELQLAQADANIDLSYTYAHNNQYAKSYPYIGRALASLEKLRHTNPEHREVLRLLGKGYTQLAISLSWDGQQAAGEAEMAKALAINEALVRREPRDAIFRHGLFATYLQSSSLYEEIDDRLSERYALKALDLTAETVAQDPANTQARQNLAKVYSRLIIISSNLNKLREANAYAEKALASVGELERSEPRNLTYKADLGRVYTRIGDTKFKQGDWRGALEAFEKSNANFEKVSRADDRDTVSLRDIAQNCKEAGQIHRDLARKIGDAAQREQHLDAARQNYERAASLLRQLKEQNALAEYDQKLFAEVQAALKQGNWK